MKTITLVKNITLIVFLIALFSITNKLNAQKEPAWMMDSWRTEQYPSNVYLTGFAQDAINKNETNADAIGRVTAMAQGNLSERIISSVKSVSDSYSQSVMEGNSESVKETFKSEIQVSTDIVINGINVESYIKDNIVYAFAYANKYEIIGYYKANLKMKVQQIEGYLNTARELEEKREKKKAKDEFNKTLPIFNEITEAQGVLIALDKNITDNDLHKEKSMKLYNEVVQANARLSQAILVYMVTQEDLFGQQVTAIEDGLKAILAENECSFTNNEEEADWKVEISATCREYNISNNFYFSYVDAKVSLFKAPSEKHVYQNEFSEKGAHTKSYKNAARAAYNDISKTIAEKILTWINN